MVGLTIQGKVWAVFDGGAKTKYGGDYSPNAVSTVPAEIAIRFTG
jgi:hypothetical protein